MAEASHISRDTLAVFMQPLWDTPLTLPAGRTEEDAARGSTDEFLPPGLPPLSTRWNSSDDFGSFSNKTLERYYNMSLEDINRSKQKS